MKYQVHIEELGWQDPQESPRIAGTVGHHLKLQAIKIDPPEIPGLGVTYKVHVSEIGWMDGVTAGEVAGTEGQNLAIEAIQIVLYGDMADQYDIWYSLHVENYGWLNWGVNGEIVGTEGAGLQAEAVMILLCEKDRLQLKVNQDFTYLKFEPVVPVETPQTGVNPRQAIIDMAGSQVGYLSHPDYDVSIYSKYFGSSGDYCHAYVSWVSCAVGLQDYYPQTTWCPSGQEWFLYHERAAFYRRESGYVPQTGDTIYFDRNYNNYADHVGFVESCDGYTINTIEGNVKDPRGVYRKSYTIYDTDILGFGVPAF